MLALLRVGLKPAGRFFSWRKNNIDARRRGIQAKAEDVEGQHQESHDLDRVENAEELDSCGIVELPAEKLDRIEVGDTALRELAGVGASKELGGDVAAIEAQAVERKPRS